MEYRHTQTAFQTVLLAVVSVLALIVVFVPGFEDDVLTLPIVAVLVLTVLAVLVFSRLTVAVGNGEVVTAFGAGWPKHTEILSQIVAVRTVRNKWIYGWGIRRLPDGWMYNVWGLDAVEVDLVSGKKFRMGTDDPEGLLAAITLSMSPR